MPFYKVGKYGPNQLSQRHPFHGFSPSAAPRASVIKAPEGSHYEQEGKDPFDFDYRMIDRRYYYAVQGYGLDAAEVWDKSKEPLIRGLISGLVAFGVARAVKAAPDKARKIGIVMGVLDAGVTFASQQLIKGATAVPPGTEVPAPTTPVSGFGWGAGRGGGI